MRLLFVLMLATPLAAQTVVSKPQTLPSHIAGVPRAASLPREENLAVIDQHSLRIQYSATGLVLLNAGKVFRQFDPSSNDCEVTKKLLVDLLAVRWGTIGKSRVVVEYGLTLDGRGELVVPVGSGFPATLTPFEMKSLRVEAVRGAWCLRDDAQVHLNFGLEKAEAEQALAVAQKYGFNRIATVGKGKTPAVTYFVTAMENAPNAAPNAPVDMQRRQDALLARSGVDIPGVGFVGEKFAIEPRKLEVRREGQLVSLRMGPDVLAKFGTDEWAARDAVRAIEQARYTEFARVGSLQFFLSNGKLPTSVPFLARTNRFDPKAAKPKLLKENWAVVDGAGKVLLAATNEVEAKDLVRIIQACEFNTVATIGGGRENLQFFVKSR